MTGTSSIAARNRVRRIAHRRKTVRSSSISREMEAGDGSVMRARASRNTPAGSVACSATIEAAVSLTVAALEPGASR
jgi:hypothetical protein